jgi:hypothetical protein
MIFIERLTGRAAMDGLLTRQVLVTPRPGMDGTAVAPPSSLCGVGLQLFDQRLGNPHRHMAAVPCGAAPVCALSHPGSLQDFSCKNARRARGELGWVGSWRGCLR